jgi:hypothetical protein
LDVPVALFLFNRPDLTARVFAEIARARPRRLLVVADGPRPGVAGEVALCAAARSVVDQVDWDCDVLTNLSDVNLGCRRRMASGISWVFDSCEEAILLEDDCLPHADFFPFCAQLLERYKFTARVMAVTGTSFSLADRHKPSYSYGFSVFPYVWGWATWRRAWKHYDPEMLAWPALRQTPWLRQALGSRAGARYFAERLDAVAGGLVDTWDYQWFYSCWRQNGVAAVPTANLISNLGWRFDATHTRTRGSALGNAPVESAGFPLHHPPRVVLNPSRDRALFERVFVWYGQKPNLYRRLHRLLATRAPGWLVQLVSVARSRLGRARRASP